MIVMDNLDRQSFLWYEIDEYLQQAQQQSAVLDKERKCFVKKNEHDEVVFSLIPPLIHRIDTEENIEEYRNNLHIEEEICFAIILIQAGAAALGIWWNDECTHHKVITAYMVRKKQGKSQLTHLNQKGKSRQGSRIRLNNTIRFFENINVKLEEWYEDLEACQRLFYSCTPRLWGELFRSKIDCPIDKEDPRWCRIPMDIKVPNFKELQRVAFKTTHGGILQ